MKLSFRSLAPLALLIPLGGCPNGIGTVQADTNSLLDSLVKGLTTADTAATTYVATCGKPGAVQCTTPAILAKLKADAHAARLALETAQSDVNQAGAAFIALGVLQADLTALNVSF